MSEDVTQPVIRTDIHSDENPTAFNYLKEVAFGFEFGEATELIRKWDKDIYVKLHTVNNDGSSAAHNASDFAEVSAVVTELNSLIDAIKINLITPDATNNCVAETHAAKNSGACHKTGYSYPKLNVYITTRSRWETISGLDSGSNFGQFSVNYSTSTHFISSGFCWIKADATEAERKSLIREEITQCLGLAKDSESYSDSIFYETSGDGGWNTSFSDLDKEIIQMLYDPRIESGMDMAQAERALKSPATMIAGTNWKFKEDIPNNSRVDIQESRLTDRFTTTHNQRS